MANNITLTSATFNASGKFGSSMKSGYGAIPMSAFFPQNGTFSVEVWVKQPTQPGAVQVAVGSGSCFWMGIWSDNYAQARYGTGSTEVTLTSAVNICDGLWHHLKLELDASGGRFYVDGVRQSSNASTMAAASPVYTNDFQLMQFGGSFQWTGEIDEVAVWSNAVDTNTTFNKPTSPWVGTETGLVALYHLDGDGTDSKTTAGGGGTGTNNQLTNNTGSVLFSPYNWLVQASQAKSINPGAYFKTIFTGGSCQLTFDLSGNVAPYSQIAYRIDAHGAWYTTTIAATVNLTMPGDTLEYNSKGGHLLEVVFKSATESVNRWSPQQDAIVLTGIVLDSGAYLAKPPSLPLKCIFYGDSITEGFKTLNTTGTNDTDRNDSTLGWAYHVAKLLGAEAGIVGFNAQGFNAMGSGSVPTWPNAYNYLWSGQARDFSSAPDFIVVNQGTNDWSNDITAYVQPMFNNLLALNSTTKILVLCPFNGGQATTIQNAISAINNTRLIYIPTSGFFNTTNSGDGLHPFGNENVNKIAPAVANAIRPYVIGTGTGGTTATKYARTVTLTLQDRSGNPKANLSNLKWAFFDTSLASSISVAASTGTAASTNASGVLSLSVQTTLSPGQTGWLILSDSTGSAGSASNAFSAPVVVS